MIYNSASFIIIAAVTLPLFVRSIVGNAFIVVSIAHTSSLISTSNVLLMNLAFTGLCVGLVAQPLFAFFKASQYRNAKENADLDILLNSAHFYSRALLCTVSFFSVTLLSVDRFLALYLHLRYNEVVTIKRVVCYIPFMWSLSACGISIGVLGKRYVDVLAAPTAGILLIVNTLLYYKIYRIV